LEADYLTAAHAGEYIDLEKRLQFVTFNLFQEGRHIRAVQRLHGLVYDTGKGAGVAWIRAQEAQLHGLRERAVEYAVEIAHRLWIPPGAA